MLRTREQWTIRCGKVMLKQSNYESEINKNMEF